LKALVAENNQTPEGITASTLRQLIINIRNAKLPNPEEIGSAGSFFMNPIVDKEVYQALSKQYPNMPHYPAPNGVKLSAGWLIDKAGWKGIKIGQSGVYEKQALVLVNHGGATGREIVELAKSIQKDIHEKFGINIYPEVIYL
jgi:UDP-N-acetylmuramate dehydrogenase